MDREISKWERLLDAFEHLLPEDTLEFVTNGPVGQLVVELQKRYGADFYCWPLERGPRAWRVVLAKPASGQPINLATLMRADHLRLGELWAQFEQAVELCQIDTIHRLSAELSLGLRRYVDIEEAVLFPVLEGQTSMAVAGWRERMRTEHREIGRIAEQLDKLRMTRECAAILEMFDRPVEPMMMFRQHCRTEEALVYPLMNMVFDPAKEHEILFLLQAFQI